MSQTATVPERPKGAWSVKDLNANTMGPDGSYIPRVHEILLASGAIKRVKLVADMPAYMPEAEARQFLKDAAFEVENAAGVKVPAITAEQQERVAPSRLSPKAVIAKWDELTDDALLTRAGIRPGFERLPLNPDRTLLIDFLEGSFQALEPDPRRDDDAMEGEEPGGAELAEKMLGGGE